MTETNPSNRQTGVFISYSRKDKAFVRRLNDALDKSGINAWVDWEGIPLSSEWMAEITHAIQNGDAFLFVISPNSVTSKVCMEELELGIAQNKKLIPILYKEPAKGVKMHPKLRKTNWVLMRTQKDDFKTTLPKLIEAINTDLGWVQQHTRILRRANEWDQKNRNNSYLLQGTDLEEGEKWMTESADDEQRKVVPLQAEYISTSRKISIKRQRSLMSGIVLAFLVSVMLGVYAFIQREDAVNNEARAKQNEQTAIANEHAAATQKAIAEDNAELAAKNEKEAESKRSAALAKIYESRPGELDTSTLLALDSWARGSSPEAEDILRHNISLLPLPVAQLQGHTGSIWNIHPSTDGSLLVTASEDGSACLWSIQGGAPKYCVRHESGDIQDAFLSLDNSLLITAGMDGTVRFWDGETGSPGELFNFNSTVWDIDISADNQWVAAGRADGSISLIDLKSRKEAVSFNLNSGEVFTVTFDPTSVWLAIGTSEGNVLLWRVNSNFSMAGPKHTSEVYAIAFSRDGTWLASVGADSNARVAKTVSGGQRHALLHGDWVEDVAFGPNGDWFATVSDDNLVRVWDTETGDEKYRMTHGDFVLRVEVSPNGEWIASSSFDKTVRIWDSASGSLMKEISLSGQGSALAFSPDGNRVITGDRSGHVGVWDISELNARVGYILFPELVRKAKFNYLGEWTLFNSDDKNVWQIPTAGLKTLHDGTGGSRVLTLKNISGQFKISPDSKWIVISETYGERASLYNLETKATFTLPLNGDVTGLAFSADGSQVATTYDDGNTVLLWNVNTGEKLDEIPFDQIAYTISYDPVDAALAIGFKNKIVLWDIAGRKEIATLNQIGDIRSLTYSRDGSWLATTSSEGSLYLWEMKSGNPSAPKYRLLQSGNITSLDFSLNNRWLASGSGDGFAYLWNLATGEEFARLPHSNAVTSVSFSNDNNLLMTVARKTVQIWDMSAIQETRRESIVENACSRLIANMSESDWQYFFSDEKYEQTCPDLPTGR